MSDENERECENCHNARPVSKCLFCGLMVCEDCAAGRCNSDPNNLLLPPSELTAADLRALAERDQPSTPVTPTPAQRAEWLIDSSLRHFLACDHQEVNSLREIIADEITSAELAAIARDQPSTPGAVTDLRQTLDAQLAILGELFDQAVKPGVTMRRKTQACDQFRIALRFVRMLATRE